MDPLWLGQLIASKICHDLITPIGAIANGMDLIRLDPQDIDQELVGLTLQSAENASARLSYFRACYGGAGHVSIDSHDKFKKIIKQYLLSQKIKLAWQLEVKKGKGYDPRTDCLRNVKLILNCIGVLSDLPIGNTKLTIDSKADNSPCSLTLEGQLVPMRQGAKEALFSGDTAEITPSNIQSYLCWHLARQGELEINVTDEAVDQAMKPGEEGCKEKSSYHRLRRVTLTLTNVSSTSAMGQLF